MSPVNRRDVLAGAAALAVAGSAPAADALEYQSAAQLADALRAKRLSSLELTDRLIARIERLDTRLNAVIARDFDRARDAAKAADAALSRGDSRAAAGHADDGEGVVQRRRPADHLGHPGGQGLPRAARTR